MCMRHWDHVPWRQWDDTLVRTEEPDADTGGETVQCVLRVVRVTRPATAEREFVLLVVDKTAVAAEWIPTNLKARLAS